MSSLVSNSLLFGRAIWIVSRLLRWQQQHTNAPPRARQCSTSSSSLVGAIAEAYRETALLQYRARRNGGTARRGGQRGWQQSHEPISAQFSALFGRHCALIGRALFFAVVSSRVSWTQSVFVWRLWRQQQQKATFRTSRLLLRARPRWIWVFHEISFFLGYPSPFTWRCLFAE